MFQAAKPMERQEIMGKLRAIAFVSLVGLALAHGQVWAQDADDDDDAASLPALRVHEQKLRAGGNTVNTGKTEPQEDGTIAR